MKQITIDFKNSNQRIDKFVRKYLNDAPLSFIYKTFRKKDIKVNGHWKDKSYILMEGDVVSLYITDEQISEFNNPKAVEKIKFNDLKIIYEDQNLLVVNKDKGLLVHGDEKEKRITLTNKVQSYLLNKGEFINNGKSYVPGPVHRLDRNTSGLVIFAKNLRTSQILLEMFKDKTNLDKYYLTLVCGKTKEHDIIDIPLIKDSAKGVVFKGRIEDGAKEAKTEYFKVAGNDEFSLLLVRLITGRTHQIRAHFKEIGFNVVGDGKYGNFKINRYFEEEFHYNSQFLHAYKLEFKEVSGELAYLSNKVIKAPLGQKEKDILKELNISYSDL